jgi:hypothetical protein
VIYHAGQVRRDASADARNGAQAIRARGNGRAAAILTLDHAIPLTGFTAWLGGEVAVKGRHHLASDGGYQRIQV